MISQPKFRKWKIDSKFDGADELYGAVFLQWNSSTCKAIFDFKLASIVQFMEITYKCPKVCNFYEYYIYIVFILNLEDTRSARFFPVLFADVTQHV